MRPIEELRKIVSDNCENDRYAYEGMSSAEIGAMSREMMFGENDEGFPSDDEWSAWVD